MLLKITCLEPKSRKETLLRKYYVVDYAGGWSTNNQIIQMALKEIELEVFLYCLNLNIAFRY